mgnify:FL=1
MVPNTASDLKLDSLKSSTELSGFPATQDLNRVTFEGAIIT